LNITYTKQAVKALMRLDVPTRQRIRQGIHKLPNGNVKRLKGYSDMYRLRIGDWRITFTMTAYDIIVEDILPRGDAYK